ncbi:MAG: restriction endonuclease, partial [Massilibacteroides sp.]|nr:restriction endonuclease [Massilibacteroides sp.]
ENYGAIGVFTPYPELNSILKKVRSNASFEGLNRIVITRTAYRLTEKMHEDHPEAMDQLSKGHAYDMSTNIFDRLPQIFYDEKPDDDYEYIQIIGLDKKQRIYKYIRKDYVNQVKNLDKYKVFVPKANGSGKFGEPLAKMIIGNPQIGSTETFVSIGLFNTKIEVENSLKFIKTKFTRALLGVLKVTQDLTPQKWAYVPLQDFTPSSDLDWTQSIPNIDRQLYAKYGLDETETAFIESHVKEMN